jgi:membrane-bound lytic murein transglycosylase B
MSQKRLTTWQKATALVPLALLSGAWTAGLAATSTARATTEDTTTTLPDGTTVPDAAIEAPASMTSPGSVAPGVPAGAADQVVASAVAQGIPAAALVAYQRAEQVINSADTRCNLTWQLIAAIGRVESDHGRYGGNVLGEDGRSRPGVYGVPLDGSDGTAQIRDTDAGRHDDDRVYDRAVGPMQFIPATWAIVGVDGDGDGTRDPQDIDDAALATAVYLCSGDEDLATREGQEAAVYRYNHSQAYVDLVISVMNAYLDGNYSPMPSGIAAPTVFVPSDGGEVVAPPATGEQKAGGADGRAKRRDGAETATRTGGGPGGSRTSGGPGGPATPGTDDPTGSPAPDLPSDGGDKPAGGPLETVEKVAEETTDTVEETTKKVPEPVQDTTKKVTEPVEDTVGGAKDAVDDVVGGLTG